MICPRCETNTTLWIQKVGQDIIDQKTRKVSKEGAQVFLCEPCKADWMSVSSHFKGYWRKARGTRLTNEDFEYFYHLFEQDGRPRFGGKTERRKFAQVAVSIVGGSKGDFTKRQAIFIPDADLVTNEDYCWAAGVIDACGKTSDPENPGKICVIVKSHEKRICDRLKDLVGGNVNKSKDTDTWTFTTTRKTSEVFLKRVNPYLRCSKENHPEELSDDDRTLAWMAGFAQASAKDGIIHTTCKWASRVLGTFFPGVETASGEEYSFTPTGTMMRERLGPFILRKLEPEGARGSTSGDSKGKAAAFQQARGEDRALGVPKGSQPERPPGPKRNSEAGSTPAEEGSRQAMSESGSTPSVWEAPPEKEDLTPEIEVSGETMVKLETTFENCIVCKKILEDLGKDKGFLKGSKEVTLVGKIGHLYAEFDIEIKAECPECMESVLLQKWTDDFSMCGFCGERVKNEGRDREVKDDKAWASK